MKCTKCSKEAVYVMDGQSVCKEHGPGEEKESGSMAEKMIGRF